MVSLNLVETEDKQFAKDQETGAVINTDVEAYKRFKLERERTKNLADTQAEVDSLKEEMTEIKTILRQILNNVSNSSKR